MRKREQLLWDAMQRRSKSRRAMPWLQRIENVVGDGIPDVVCVVAGRTVWVELKAPPGRRRITSLLLGGGGLRQSQINWHVKSQSKGAETYTLIKDGNGELFLVGAEWSSKLNELTVADVREVRAAATWDGIFDVLENGL